ncbi:MAG: hypothetical protein JRF33_26645, partial [Deltaproteobacteria bacterium]|nr:hypothetical protein [Deltaproteobacteria bacterium]
DSDGNVFFTGQAPIFAMDPPCEAGEPFAPKEALLGTVGFDTAGGQAVFLPGLWCDAAKCGKPPVDAVDIHVYHQEGGLLPREDLPVDIGDLPLLVGECGEREGNDRPGNDHLLHYFHNGKKLGYEAVFFWKFEGPGMLALRRDEKLHEPQMFDPTDLGVKLRILIERGLDSFKEA